jgi:antitoxin FitA
MSNITLHQLAPQLTQRLQQRAHQNGRTIEAEITAILASILLPEEPHPVELDLATALEQRFAAIGEFDIPELPREPIRTPPLF